MKRFLTALVLILGLTGPVHAQSADIRSTIEGQLQAFQTDDFGTAFSFAAPNIKSMFGTAENFGLMVRRGYPMVWRNNEVRFLELRELDGRMWQKVQIEAKDGSFHYLDYLMQQSAQGWQIAAVQYLQVPDVGA